MFPIVSKLTQLDVAAPQDGQSPVWDATQQKWIPSTLSGGSGNGFSFVQSTPIAIWTINHNLGRRPIVVSEDSANDVIIGNVHYIDNNILTITFSGAVSGRADLR